jgi:hypothetical protein
MTSPPPDVPPVSDLLDPPFTDDDLGRALAIDEYAEQTRAALADAHGLAEGLVPTVVHAADADGVEAGPNGLLVLPDAHEDQTRPLRWQIDGVRAAEWAMVKLREAADAQQALAAEAAAMLEPLFDQIERVNTWERDQAVALDQKVRFFRGHLERWALDQRTATGAKSQKLPSGTIETRESAARFEVTNPGDAVRFARTVGAEVKETVGVAALKDKVRIVEHLVWWTGGLPLDQLQIALREAGADVPDDRDAAVEEAWKLGLRDEVFAVLPQVRVEFWPTHSPYDIEHLGADPDEGKWVAVDPETGEVVIGVRIEHGPFVVDADGLPVPGLAAIPAKVTPTVTLNL